MNKKKSKKKNRKNITKTEKEKNSRTRKQAVRSKKLIYFRFVYKENLERERADSIAAAAEVY